MYVKKKCHTQELEALPHVYNRNEKFSPNVTTTRVVLALTGSRLYQKLFLSEMFQWGHQEKIGDPHFVRFSLHFSRPPRHTQDA